jgi:hypothetical protein
MNAGESPESDLGSRPSTTIVTKRGGAVTRRLGVTPRFPGDAG